MSIPAPASFRRRFAALCYEALLLAETAVALIILAVWWGYFRLCWHSPRGQTLPMKVWRLQLQTPAGSRPSLRQLCLRFIWATVLLLLLPLASFGILRQLTPLPPQTVAGMALAWWILPIGFALIHPSRQFLYDYLAGTVLTGKGREEPLR